MLVNVILSNKLTKVKKEAKKSGKSLSQKPSKKEIKKVGTKTEIKKPKKMIKSKSVDLKKPKVRKYSVE
jgi:hypothetical protein